MGRPKEKNRGRGSALPLPSSRFYVISAVSILFFTGLLKVLSFSFSSSQMRIADPVTGFPAPIVYIAVGILEIIAAAAIIWLKAGVVAGTTLVWLSANFLVYRVFLFFSDGWQYCPCLGSLGTKFEVKSEAVNAISTVLSLALLSIGFVWARGRQIDK